ncbi:Aldose sugar dehydrogenase YliI [Alphaproteobacteria bacterium SO-S41]|nr:Aldose sugar dehydrogenase YliI [Alphaproteobacteria bacterium SO-S41]
MRSTLSRLFTAGATAAAALLGTAAAETLSSQAGPINVEVLTPVENPWGMAYLPDGRLLISEKQGELRIFADGKLGEAIGGLPEVEFKGQGGLLDVEIDPKFAENQLVYIYYVEAADPQPDDAKEPGDTRTGTKPNDDIILKGGAVARGRLEGNEIKELTTIWRQEPKEIGRGHFGGRLAFAPDGKLFISSGERQRFDPAQDLKGNLGKIIRINPDGSTPSDNPFIAQGGRADIYSMGHRNPLGLAIHPTTGALWENEMGPKGGDEINIIEPGKNYGWPIVSDGDNYDDTPIPDHKTRPEFQAPIISWNPVISPSGMAFYTADLFPTWKGSVLLGGLSSTALIRVMLDGDKVTGEERITTGQRIRDVIQAPDGAILLLTEGTADGDPADGQLWRLTPAK